MESLTEEAPGRRSNASSSPEFEFWVVNNPNNFPQTPLLTADQLFANGLLLPLHLLPSTNPDSSPTPELSLPLPSSPPLPSSSPSPSPASLKSWKDAFKATGERRHERNANAELNINLWPFSRSRSARAGAAPGRPKPARKASSAPCSRSNSRGESSKPPTATTATTTTTTTKKLSAVQLRAGFAGGIRLSRHGLVWPLKKITKSSSEPKEKKDEIKEKKNVRSVGVKVLSLNVNTCIGHRNQVSCAGGDKDGATGGDRMEGGALFSLRTLLSKKVY